VGRLSAGGYTGSGIRPSFAARRREICHLRGVRLAAIVVLVVFAVLIVAGRGAAGTGDARDSPPRWSLARVMHAIDGRRVPVDGRRVRIEGDSTLCGGLGASVRVAGVRRWSRFACTFTAFGARGIERDLDFRVRVLGARRIALTSARWVGGR
jgi:uncharacterized Zn-binding protein involved in type VI secretion